MNNITETRIPLLNTSNPWSFVEQIWYQLDDFLTISNNNISHINATDSPLDEFPEYFSVEELRQGWIVLHVIAAIYLFVLLGIICNNYFLPTVECICEDLNLSKDVAAATFMATATSMPEFFTNSISTLLTGSDIGLGTIIGSLMFNTLGVASLAAMVLDKPIQLDWWPIARDCFIYGLNTVILIILTWGGNITFMETCFMMVLLILYYVITFNINRFMPAIRVFVEDYLNCCFSTRYDFTQPPENSAKAQLPIKKEHLSGNGQFVINLPENTDSTSSRIYLSHSQSWNSSEQQPHSTLDSSPADTFKFPVNASVWLKIWWLYTLPLNIILLITIPNPLRYRCLYPLSFIMCFLAIGLNAYLIVWMLTALGVTIGIPTIIMGLTFLAAGSTMPEVVSSIISLRNGENGIGVSNSLGANSLAILLSLGVPWFIKQNISPDNNLTVGEPHIQYNLLILVISTAALFIVLSGSGYRLTKRVGVLLFIIYLILIVLQVLIEMKIIVFF